MTWLIFAILSVLIYSSKSLFQRVLMKEEQSDPYLHSVVYYIVAGIIALVISLFSGGFQYHLSLNQIALFIPLTIITAIGLVLLFKSFQNVEASENTIIQSSGKLWTVIGAFIFLHEVFSIKTLIGTVLIIIGIAITIYEKKKIKFNNGVILVFIATVFYSIGDLISYYLVRDLNPMSFMVYLYFLTVVVLLIIKPKTIFKIKYFFKPQRAIVLTWLSLISTVGSAFSFLAYKAGGGVGQITVILGLTTFFSVLMSVTFLKERNNLLNKIIGAIIVVVGALFVV